PGTTVSQINFLWNCHTVTNLGRLGPAAAYRIRARDPLTGEFYEIDFAAGERAESGFQNNSFSTPVVTGELLIELTARELGVDFYSLKEIQILNGSSTLLARIPTALNSFV